MKIERLNEDLWYEADLRDRSGNSLQRYAYLSANPTMAQSQLNRILNDKTAGTRTFGKNFSTARNWVNVPSGCTLINLRPMPAPPAASNLIITDRTRAMRTDAHADIDTRLAPGIGDYYTHHLDGDESNNANNNLALIPISTVATPSDAGKVHWALELFGVAAANRPPINRTYDFYLVDPAGKLIPRTLTLTIT